MESNLISIPDKNRAERDHAAAVRNGFADSRTVYAIGTTVNDIGIANARKFRNDFDSLPGAFEVADQGIAMVQAEDRQFVEGNAPDFRMDNMTGEMRHLDGRPSALHTGRPIGYMTERAFELACRSVVPGGGSSYLIHCPVDVRAWNLNHWLERAYLAKRGTPKEMNLWTRVRDGNREIFSVFGSRYVPFDGAKILSAAMDKIPAGSKGLLKYDGSIGQFDMVLHSDVQATNYVAGEYFKCGIRLKWADDGSGSVRAEVFALRNLCRNLIILANSKQALLRRRHMGTEEAIRADLQNALDVANEKIAHFANVWDSANKERILEKYDMSDPGQVFRGLVGNGVIKMPGYDLADAVQILLDAYAYEPSETRAGIINAITRAAHTADFANPWAGEALEETAGELLYVKNWNVHYEE